MRLKRCLSVKLAIAAGFLAAELRPESTHVAQLTTCQAGGRRRQKRKGEESKGEERKGEDGKREERKEKERKEKERRGNERRERDETEREETLENLLKTKHIHDNSQCTNIQKMSFFRH